LASSAFFFSEAIKARTLLESIAQRWNSYRHSELPPEIRTKELEIVYQLSLLEEEWEKAYQKGEGMFQAFMARKKSLNQEWDYLLTRIKEQAPMYAALNYPSPIRVENLPLKENEVLLEYLLVEDTSYLFVVENGKVVKLVKIPAGKDDIEGYVTRFMAPLHSFHTKKKFSPLLGNKLYNLLLAEALKNISPDRNVIIVPDGMLGLLPFETLVINPDEDLRKCIFVADRWRIRYAQSASVLALIRRLGPSYAHKSLFALGNPIYNQNDPRLVDYQKEKKASGLLDDNLSQYAYRGLATRREWGKTDENDREGKEIFYPPLPETDKEVREIARLLGILPRPPDVLLGVLANETNLRKQHLGDYRYLHLATHADLPGKIQGINEPFILLGQVQNQGKDDGFLTLSETLDLKLNADMVVLSACMTGRGNVMEGEGVVNFARAFHHSGARSVVVSLWEVASQEAVEYMITFYGYLKGGKGKAEALRLARKEIKAKYPNPFYWAVFILHGEG